VWGELALKPGGSAAAGEDVELFAAGFGETTAHKNLVVTLSQIGAPDFGELGPVMGVSTSPRRSKSSTELHSAPLAVVPVGKTSCFSRPLRSPFFNTWN
jgi:hypothetical protein